ncbi:serine/threonine-protein kinase [Nonomuraea sp. NPDC049419]|uniref:serine/threonine-protein kinase n=1 Tax=Nonomuraea sp. NPDC049419 TaxID=3155772 RepID=UPI0034300689
MNPLLAGDPAEVDGHRVVGRLGQGGQGVVYLGEAPAGTPVAIKMLGPGLDDPEARDRFRQEIGYARRVKAFCTAQVLASGEFAGTPYVVSEYVDGPALADVLVRRGPLRGAELRRLAIGTLTALAAIHQAGVVHRDFKPGNVLLSRHGPRVIDFGISRALEEIEADGQHIVGTPPYMAPEQFGGAPVGPAADMFAWAGTMVAAATGRPAFGTGELPALIARILTAEPDLGNLDGELRELAARCLDKDPDARPTATQALLTLLGHPGEAPHDTVEQRLLAQGRQSAAPPRPRRWPLGVAAAGTALAVSVAVLLLRPAPEAAPRPPAVASAPLPTPSPGTMAPEPVTETKVPATGIVLHENPADPLWVSSYRSMSSSVVTGHVRDPATGAFAFFGNLEEPIVSPGGRFVASLTYTRLLSDGFETITIRDRATRQERKPRTVDKPRTLMDPVWAEDGRRLLATVVDYDYGGDKETRTVGFAVVDAVTGGVMVTEAPGPFRSRYAWGSDFASVLQRAGDGSVRVLSLNGTVLRSFEDVGELEAGGAVRSALGTVFPTACPGTSRDICFWDERTGARKGTARLPAGAVFHGWLDGDHLLATVREGRRARVVMADAAGKPVRTLISATREELDDAVFWFSRK